MGRAEIYDDGEITTMYKFLKIRDFFGPIPLFNEFMIYDSDIKFSEIVRGILKSTYWLFIGQILFLILITTPHRAVISKIEYSIIFFTLLLLAVMAFRVEIWLAIFAYDYYHVFPRLTDGEKDALRKAWLEQERKH